MQQKLAEEAEMGWGVEQMTKNTKLAKEKKETEMSKTNS